MPDHTLALIESLPKCLTMHGIVPEVAGKQQLLAFLQGTHDSTGRVDVFTDGTAVHPGEPVIRLAAWAVIVVVAPGSTQAHCVPSGPLPGLVQTVHRAEIMALIAALRYAVWVAKAPRIWIDNQSVQRKAQSICERLWAPTPNSRDSDLWQVVAALVGSVCSR